MRMVETPDIRSNEELNIPFSPDALLVEHEYPDIELDAEMAAFSELESKHS